ncbi:MAG: glycosyltransferase family 2 protein [Methylocella sp.]
MPVKTSQRISVVIPTYNRADLLSRTLQAYCHQSYPYHQHEIIVIDDGSTDKTESVVSHHLGNIPYELKYLRLDHAGPATARNKGIQLATGDRILFTNDDIFPERDLLQQHALTSEKYPEAGILGFVEWSPDLNINDFMHFVAPAGAQFDYSDIIDPLNCGHAKFYGANLSIPVHWTSDERFDEKISTATLEDHEYGYRLEKHGLKIVFNPNAIGYHYHPMTHSSFLARMEEAGKAIRYLWNIHPELEKELRPLAFVPMGLLQSTIEVLSPACRLVNRKLFWQLTMMSSYLKGIRTGERGA